MFFDIIRWQIAWFFMPRWARKVVAEAVSEMTLRNIKDSNND